MAYTSFNVSKPDPTADNGTQAFDYTRENMLALRDAVVIGVFSTWDMKPKGSDLSQPASVVWSAPSGEHIKADNTYDGNGNATQVIYAYSSNGSAYDVISTATITYDASSNVTGTTWG